MIYKVAEGFPSARNYQRTSINILSQILIKSGMLPDRSIPPIFFNLILNYGQHKIVSVSKAAETVQFRSKGVFRPDLLLQAVSKCLRICLKTKQKHNE